MFNSNVFASALFVSTFLISSVPCFAMDAEGEKGSSIQRSVSKFMSEGEVDTIKRSVADYFTSESFAAITNNPVHYFQSFPALSEFVEKNESAREFLRSVVSSNGVTPENIISMLSDEKDWPRVKSTLAAHGLLNDESNDPNMTASTIMPRPFLSSLSDRYMSWPFKDKSGEDVLWCCYFHPKRNVYFWDFQQTNTHESTDALFTMFLTMGRSSVRPSLPPQLYTKFIPLLGDNLKRGDIQRVTRYLQNYPEWISLFNMLHLIEIPFAQLDLEACDAFKKAAEEYEDQGIESQSVRDVKFTFRATLLQAMALASQGKIEEAQGLYDTFPKYSPEQAKFSPEVKWHLKQLEPLKTLLEKAKQGQ